jgi:arsenate reductase-like glutaredoxin family protein
MTRHGIVNCDTVRKARAWFDAQRIPYEFVALRRSPPTLDALSRWSAAAPAACPGAQR